MQRQYALEVLGMRIFAPLEVAQNPPLAGYDDGTILGISSDFHSYGIWSGVITPHPTMGALPPYPRLSIVLILKFCGGVPPHPCIPMVEK